MSTCRLLAALVFLQSVAAFTMEVDLQCRQCNASFYCTGGERFQCPANSLANSWPASNVTHCTCNNGYQATPALDHCDVGQPPFYYEAGYAKSCAGDLRQTILPLADTTDPRGWARAQSVLLDHTRSTSTQASALHVLSSRFHRWALRSPTSASATRDTRGKTAARASHARRGSTRERRAALPACSVTRTRTRHQLHLFVRHVATTRRLRRKAFLKTRASAIPASTSTAARVHSARLVGTRPR